MAPSYYAVSMSRVDGRNNRFQAIEFAHPRQDRRRVGALSAALLDSTALLAESPPLVEPQTLRPRLQQAAPELAPHRGIKARVRQLQREQIFPIHLAAHSIGRRLVTQVRGIRQPRDERPPPRVLSRLSGLRLARCKPGILIAAAHLIAPLEPRVSFFTSRPGDTPRLGGDFRWGVPGG